MSQATHQNAHPAADLHGLLSTGVAGFVAIFRQHVASLQGRSALSEMSDRQLEDMGIDRASLRPHRPTLEIETGLMQRLMSMR
jgi:hypothetical protein